MLTRLGLNIQLIPVPMAGQMNSQDSNNSLSSPLPSLPSDLNSLYLSLPDDMQRLFIRVFRYLWGVVNGWRYGFVPLFWAVDLLRLRFSLTSSELTVLTYIYYASHKGKRFIHSDLVYNGTILQDLIYKSKQGVLNDLKHKGYISRSTRDPGQPYSQRAQHNKQPVYISLTPAGIKLIEKCERDLYNIIMNTSLDDLTGNKKAR